jgi:Dolichyl-phosphate-mannose-protein mannosyltransferase
MAIALIFISLIASIWWLFVQSNDPETSLRVAILKGFILHGWLIAVSTEGLSATRSLDFAHIVILWLTSMLIHSLLLYRIYQAKARSIADQNYLNLSGKAPGFWLRIGQSIGSQFKDCIREFRVLDRLSQFSILATIVILSISLITGLIAAPNNWDGMTYHLPRVMHWIQNHTVAHYPTHNLRQISLPPGAAYIVTHLQILAGSDRFASTVQWLAFGGSILGISLLTKEIVGIHAQWVSMLLCASLPMAILQSMTTQVDLVMSFWLVCFTYFSYSFQKKSQVNLFWITASLSLAILTKPTAIIFGTPLIVGWGIRLVKTALNQVKSPLKSLTQAIGIIVLVVFGGCALSIPTWIRNTYTFGQFLGIDIGTRSQVSSWPDFISVMLKNLGLNLTIPGYAEMVVFIHEYLLKTDINKASLTYADPPIPFNHPLVAWLNLVFPFEDTVGSPIHLILFIISGLFLLYFQVRKRKSIVQPHSDLYLLMGVILVGYGLYSYLLKWQPWGNRLLMTLFILQTPLIAYYLTHGLKRQHWQRKLLSLVALVALLYALTPLRRPLLPLPNWSPYLSQHQSASILTLSREQTYFSGSLKYLEITYHNLIDAVQRTQCQRIGLMSGEDDWEYPLWVLLRAKMGPDFRFKHVQVKNTSAKLVPEFPDAEVCAIVSTTGKVRVVKPDGV